MVIYRRNVISGARYFSIITLADRASALLIANNAQHRLRLLGSFPVYHSNGR